MRSFLLACAISVVAFGQAKAQDASQGMPTKFLTCVVKTVQSITDADGRPINWNGPDKGYRINYAGGGNQSSPYRTPRKMEAEPGDKVFVCLTHVSRLQPRCEVEQYSWTSTNLTDQRAGVSWSEPDASSKLTCIGDNCDCP